MSRICRINKYERFHLRDDETLSNYHFEKATNEICKEKVYEWLLEVSMRCMFVTLLIFLVGSVGSFSFAQTPTRGAKAVAAFLSAVEKGDKSLAASALSEILHVLEQNPVKQGDNYYRYPDVKAIMLGLETGIGGYEEYSFAANRSGGLLLSVNNVRLIMPFRADKNVKPHRDSTGKLIELEYYDSEYIGHNDTDHFKSHIKLTPQAQAIWSQELTDVFVKILSVYVVTRSRLAKDIQSMLVLNAQKYPFDRSILPAEFSLVFGSRGGPCEGLSE